MLARVIVYDWCDLVSVADEADDLACRGVIALADFLQRVDHCCDVVDVAVEPFVYHHDSTLLEQFFPLRMLMNEAHEFVVGALYYVQFEQIV